MDVSLGAIRERLLNFRSWDSSGTTLNNRIREAINTALDRLAGDVPEALIPDEEHIVLLPDYKGSDTTVAARLKAISDQRVLEFSSESGGALGAAPTWAPTVDGTWDGVYHLEIKDPAGVWHRRQSREWWTTGSGASTTYFVSLDRKWQNTTDTLMDFRIHQPEFFMTDDVMEVLEPARIWDSTKQQIWKIDTAGAYRQDMVDFQGNTTARPYRMWRGRHFQMPTPREAPVITVNETDQGAPSAWVGPEQAGTFRFCYTFVWGRRDAEWQYSPGGVQDPQWESAPSPVSAAHSNVGGATYYSITIRAENIDFMTDFDIASSTRETRSGMRIRLYAARDGYVLGGGGSNNIVEKAGIFYLLKEIDPGTTAPTAEFTWTGVDIPGFYRPLKHSTGYYAWKTYPHQDSRYELDFRVLRLPRKFIDDQDTAPIQRDAVTALIELSLHYMSLLDGADQNGAQIHLQRYQELARRYRSRYANPGGIVEPASIGGYGSRQRYGTFRTSE